MNKKATELKQHVGDLIELPLGDRRANKKVRKIARILIGLTKGTLIHRKDTSTGYGEAISPFKAASCLNEVPRTHMLIKGAHQGILTLQKTFQGEVIRILCAGCGPLDLEAATLATQFEPGEVEFTPMDIHSSSVECTDIITERLDMQNKIKKAVLTDAIRYTHEGPPPHMIFTETMVRGLAEETQAAITANLGPQLHPDGIFIPQLVKTQLFLGRPGEQDSQCLGTICELDKDFGANGEALAKLLEIEKNFSLPEITRRMILTVKTIVRVFDGIEIPRGTLLTEDLKLETVVWPEDTPGELRFNQLLGAETPTATLH